MMGGMGRNGSLRFSCFMRCRFAGVVVRECTNQCEHWKGSFGACKSRVGVRETIRHGLAKKCFQWLPKL